ALRAGHRLRPWTCRQITLIGSGAFDGSSGSRNSSSPSRFAQRGKQLSISGSLGNGGRRRCSGNGFRISRPAPAAGKPLATRQDLSAAILSGPFVIPDARRHRAYNLKPGERREPYSSDAYKMPFVETTTGHRTG